LLAAHVESVFKEFLGRTPSPRDVETWMRVGSLRALLDGVIESEEYARRTDERSRTGAEARQGPFVNCWAEGVQAFTRPVGSLSADRVAMVGRHGHLFLYGGSNQNLANYLGAVPMASDWHDEWRELIGERLAQAQASRLTPCFLVVPDKLAVYPDLFPAALASAGQRPIRRLIDDGSLPLLYPSEQLARARAGGDIYMSTDTHLTLLGNRVLASVTLAALGCTAEPSWEVTESSEQVFAGDLGRHFNPPVVELAENAAISSRAEMVHDNHATVSAAGGHIGTTRVFRSPDARDPRTLVVFGDSYGLGGTVQGFVGDIYRGLSWILAQVFREVHFVWVPFGWDPDYLDSVGAELVVCETAERFIPRVPRRRVDVRQLAREAAGPGGALGLERIFGDVR
jgi:hypothetical protein